MKFRLPDNGDIRIVKRFALFPIIIYNEVRWLEIVQIKQEYYLQRLWVNKEFIDHE